MERHTFYMRQALSIAQYSAGRTAPNPMVGAVIVKNGEVVGQGWHRQAGTPHAEIHALHQAGELARGATMYVTLEPCCHYGRTGPCTEAIIRAGVNKVVVAMMDPNAKVSGCGIGRLRSAGIEVIEDVLACEAARMNEVFIKWISTGMPFGVLKTAMTLDGKIATHTGHSTWITGETARRRVHHLRNLYDAILVGIGTVIADDPHLTTRLPEGGRNPVRVILDSNGRIPHDAVVLNDETARTLLFVAEDTVEEKGAGFRFRQHVEVIPVARAEQGLDLRQTFQELAARQLTSVLIEGGSAINASALQAGIVDKVKWFIAPKIIGGAAAPSPIAGKGGALMGQADLLEDVHFESVGDDILITGYMKKREGRDVYRTCGRIGSD